MNDDQLRELVRSAVARHLVPGTGNQVTGGSPTQRPYPQPGTRYPIPDASHYIYLSLTNDSGACVIEPNVPCNHCNYCKSHGH